MANVGSAVCLRRFFLRRCIVLCVFMVFGSQLASADERIVKVGVYENPPKVFTSESGEPAGIFIDLIEHIARSEGWTLQYVPGTWAEGLDRLQKAEIDLMPDVAHTADRETHFSFHKVSPLSSWSQVYTSKGSKIQSILDLDRKRIAVLEGSVQKEAVIRFAESFGLNITLVPVLDFRTVFEIVARGEADAAVTNRFYGLMHSKKFGLEDTAVAIAPSALFFAAPLNASTELLSAIDIHLSDLKRHSQSVYYTSLKRWTSEEVEFNLPNWLKMLAFFVGALLLIILVGALVLKHQLNARTQELKKINQELEREARARREAEQTLRGSERKYRLLAENTVDAIWTMDLDLTFTHVNPAVQIMMGYSPEEWIGSRLADHLDGENFAKTAQAIADGLAKGPRAFGIRHETVMLKKSGEPIPIEVHAKAIYDEKGVPMFFQGVARDITERKRVEEALRKSEATLQSVFRAAPIGVCIMKDRIYQSANDFWCESFGYPEEDILGKEPRMLYESDEEYERVGRELYIGLHERGLASTETKLRRSDGVFRDVVLIASPLHRDDPSAGTVAVIQDVTERKRAEHALKQSEEKFKFLTEHMADIVWTMDLHFRLTYVSPSVEKMLGFTPEERKRQSLEEMVTPESMRTVLAVFERELEIDRQGTGDADRFITLEVEYYHKNGSTVPVENNIKAIRDSEGTMIGLYGVTRDITERKKAEEALRKSEMKYRSIFDNSIDAILLTQPNGHILDANPAACRMFGRTVEDIIGIGRNGLVDITDPRLQKGLEERERSGKAQAELTMVRADQAKFPAILSSTVFVDEDGQRRTTMIIRDITDQKKEEELIRQQIAITQAINRSLKAALLAKTDVEVASICLTEAERLSGSEVGWIGEVNPSGRMDTIVLSAPGWNACTIPGHGAAAIRDMQIRGIFGRVLKDGKSLITNEPGAHPDRIGLPNGHPALTAFLGVPLKQESRTIGMVALANKTSGYTQRDQEAIESLSVAFVEALQRKRAEAALRESEEKYRGIFENAQEGIYQSTSDGRFLTANRALSDMLGYGSPEELITTITDIKNQLCVNPQDWEVLNEKSARKSMTNNLEICFYRKDGTKIWVLSTRRNVHGEDGRVLYCEGVFLDITSRKEAEDKYKATIEQLVEAKEMLLHSEKLAAVGKLSAGVSHEILNPLNVLSLRLQLMERTERLSDKTKESLEVCKEQIKRIVKITSDLSQFSRITTAHLELANVNEIIEYAFSLAAPRLKVENVNIRKALQQDLPEILLDKFRIEQVILNLINNAVDAMRKIEQRKVLCITTKTGTFEGKKSVRVTLADNGTGIREEDYLRVFDPFFTIKEQGQGTGLGLSICYGIIKDHGGTIWTENNPEGGATFHFELPVEQKGVS